MTAHAADAKPNISPQLRWYGFALLLVVSAHLVIEFSHGLIKGPAAYIVFMGAVVIVALSAGMGPALLATVLSCVDLLYTFLPPYNSFNLDFQSIVFLTAFLSVALITTTLQARRRQAEESLRVAHDELEDRVRERTSELARSQAQLGLLINGVVDQAFFMLDSKGIVASWNSGSSRLFGYSASDIVGQPVQQILPGLPLLESRKTLVEEQDWAIRRDGGRVWAAMVITPMRGDGGMPGGYAVALRDITERRSLERDILEIAEREQERIGRDLHDGLGQELTGIAMLSTALAQRLTDGVATAPEAEQVAELVHESIRHTRDLARGLCPVNLEDDGLAAALELLCQRIDRLPDIHCTFEADAASREKAALNEAIATHLYRIAQEATTNAIRHGKAANVSVSLLSSGRTMKLSIKDDGGGFPARGAKGGMGLRLMQHRAKMCRASLIIQPGGDGTVVECSFAANGGA